MNGFFKAVWYISLNPFVSKLPSGSPKYPSLTSSALMLKLGKLCADAPMRNKRKGYQSIYIPRQQKTVVSTKTDNSNLRLLKSLAYSNHIVSILLAYTWHIKSIFRHMVSICFLYANYMPGVWERYAIIIASLL